MGQQRITGAFRAVGPAVNPDAWNLLDPGAASGGWTEGATLVDNVPIQQPLGQAWSIVSFSISFYGLIVSPAAQHYGKLGNIIGGLVHGSSTIDQSYGPWVQPALPVPRTPAGLVTLWDGSADPAFPYWPTPPIIPTTVDTSLAVPIANWPGDTVQIGLWALPSLAYNASIGIKNASYSIVYDDGQPITGSAII